jgi:murein DD-endopeptidase MepM/ murein hydrolase activator NlpD
MRLRVLTAGAAAPLVLWAALPLGSQGAGPSARSAQLQSKIETLQGKIGRKKGTERVLSGDIATYSRRINRLQGRISSLQSRQVRVQADLDAKQAELERIQTDLRRERARLTRLRARLIVTRRALADRLVEIYQADKPDLVTVVLNSKGFADLLERSEFVRRISDQDRRIVTLVRDAKADATATAQRLDRLERRQQQVTAIVLERRNAIAVIKQDLIDTRVGYAGTRADKRRALSKVRWERHELQEDLAAHQREQARVQAKLRRAATGFSPLPAGPIRGGSGQFIWPVSGPITGSFGEARPGHMHAGIDIAAPGGTPIRAAGSGRVVLLGWTGGYGNYTCIAHSASLSTCYAHQSGYATRNGATVSRGQVIGYVGNTGHSFGNHLHFEVRVGGSPVNPLNYL